MEDERKRLLLVEQHALVESEAARQRLSSILDNLMDGFMLFDTQWRYTYINARASPFTGKPREELPGKNVWEEFPALVNSSFYRQYHDALLRQELLRFCASPSRLQISFRQYSVTWLNSEQQTRPISDEVVQTCNPNSRTLIGL